LLWIVVSKLFPTVVTIVKVFITPSVSGCTYSLNNPAKANGSLFLLLIKNG
jgi:hypothetical protein